MRSKWEQLLVPQSLLGAAHCMAGCVPGASLCLVISCRPVCVLQQPRLAAAASPQAGLPLPPRWSGETAGCGQRPWEGCLSTVGEWAAWGGGRLPILKRQK